MKDSCNPTVLYTASDFPSHKAYFNDMAIATRYQFGLPRFMFAGGGVDAPGWPFVVHENGSNVELRPVRRIKGGSFVVHENGSNVELPKSN